MDKITSRPLILLFVAAAIFIIMFGIQGAAFLFNPILLAAVITITVLPIPGRLASRGMSGTMSMVVSIGLVALVLALVIVTVFFSINKLTTELPQYQAAASEQYAEDVSSLTGDEASTQPPPLVSGLAQSFLGVIADVLVQMGIALFIFFFMIGAAVSLPAASRLGLDPNSPLISRVSSLTEDVRKYISVLTLINLLVGLGDTIFLLIMGVEYALLWGLLAWFMGYIPSIGFMIALIPPVLMAYAQYDLQTALIVLVGYILINGGVENFVKPKRMGHSLHVAPLVVFMGLFIWGFLLGGIGAILAVPLTMMVVIILENIDGTRPLAALMRHTGKEEDEAATNDNQP